MDRIFSPHGDIDSLYAGGNKEGPRILLPFVCPSHNDGLLIFGNRKNMTNLETNRRWYILVGKVLMLYMISVNDSVFLVYRVY